MGMRRWRSIFTASSIGVSISGWLEIISGNAPPELYNTSIFERVFRLGSARLPYLFITSILILHSLLCSNGFLRGFMVVRFAIPSHFIIFLHVLSALRLLVQNVTRPNPMSVGRNHHFCCCSLKRQRTTSVVIWHPGHPENKRWSMFSSQLFSNHPNVEYPRSWPEPLNYSSPSPTSCWFEILLLFSWDEEPPLPSWFSKGPDQPPTRSTAQ